MSHIKTTFVASIILLSLAAVGGAQSGINRSRSSLDMQGVLSPFRTTDVATSETGILRETFVKPGDEITRGTSIGRLDWELQTAVLHEAEVEASSMGALELAKREVEFQRKRVDVTIPLVNELRASPRELERFQLELQMAEAKLQAQSEAKQLTLARLEKAKIALHERTVRAPHDGIVVELVRREGEYVAGTNPVLLKLLDTTKLRAEFSVSQDIADRFRNRKQAEVRLPNNAIVIGDIEFIAPFEHREGGEIAITILINNENGVIRYSKCFLVLP